MGIRKYPDAARVYIDMDGVLADFISAANQCQMEPAHFKRVAGAYLNLAPMPGAIEAVATLQAAGFTLFALTKIPHNNPYAATEKLLWIRQHIPLLDDHVIISPDKGAVGTKRDFLVDDRPDWANADNFPGSIIHFKNDWPDALRLILKKST